jgi:Uri superfamily endonuclease
MDCATILTDIMINSYHKNHQGVYTLIIRLSRPCVTTAGENLPVSLRRGLYLYTGSALGRGSTSLEGRISRHLRRAKKEFWHIDCILACKHAQIVSVVFAKTTRKAECTVNAAILHSPNIRVTCEGVGSSDCRCNSHLLAADGPLRSAEEVVRSSYARLMLRPQIFRDFRTGRFRSSSASPRKRTRNTSARRTRRP